MRKTIMAVLSALILLLAAIPAWAQGPMNQGLQISQPGPVSTFGFTDNRDRDVSPAISSYEMWPAWQDSFGKSYSQPLIVQGTTSGGAPATYIIAVGGGTTPQIAVWLNKQAQPTGQYQSNAPIWAHPIEGSQPTTSHPSLYDINGNYIVFVGTEPGSQGYSYVDGFDITGILNGTSKQGTLVLDAADPNASDIVSAPLLMQYQGHLVLIYTDGNSGRVGLMFGIDGLANAQTISSQHVAYLDPGGRTSSSPAPVMDDANGNPTAFAVGVDTGGAPGAVYVYKLSDLFTATNAGLTWSNNPGFYWKAVTHAGVDASFSVDPNNSNNIYFADSRSYIYGINVSTKTSLWPQVNSDVPNSIGYPNDFSNRSPAFDGSTVYVPVGTKPGLTRSGVIAVSASTGHTQWVSQYSIPTADTNPNDIQIAGFNAAGDADPTNSQTAPVIMPNTESGVPLIIEGLGDDQIAFIDSSNGYEPLTESTHNPVPIRVSGSYATGVTGEISIATDNSPGANNGLIAYTTQNGLDVLDFVPTDISISGLTITGPTGKLTPNAQGIYSVLAGTKYQVSATVKYSQSPSGDPSDTSWPLANVPVDGFVNTGGTLPTGAWTPQGTATTPGSQPDGGTWYPVKQLDNASGTPIQPQQVDQIGTATQAIDPTVSLPAQNATAPVSFSWTPSASDVSSTDPYVFLGMFTNENFPAGDNPPLVQAYPDVPLYNNSVIVPVTIEAPALVVTPANASVQVSQTQQFTAEFYPTGVANGNGQPVTTSSAWTSSSPGIATVGYGTGLATGQGPGSTTITAEYDNLTGQAVLNVTAPPVANQSGGLTFQAISQDGTTQRTAGTAKWTDWVTATLTPPVRGQTWLGEPTPPGTIAPPWPPSWDRPPREPSYLVYTGKAFSSIDQWGISNITLTYPAQNPQYSFGNPLPPIGTDNVSMSSSGHAATGTFQEMWAEDGARVFNVLTQQTVGPPKDYTLTAAYDWFVTYSDTYLYRDTRPGGGIVYIGGQNDPLDYSSHSTLSGQLLVDGTGVVGLGS